MPAALTGTWGVVLTVAMLTVSNLLMLFAWYWHIGTGDESGPKSVFPFLCVLVSWGIAFFEYCILVPANRIGEGAGLSLGQLKIIQEVVTVAVFIPFMLFVKHQEWHWDYLWALLCMVGAVYFVNRVKA